MPIRKSLSSGCVSPASVAAPPFVASRRHVLRAGAAIAFTGVPLLLGACGEKPPAFNGIDITGADYATAFQLTDHNGQSRTLADFKGKVVVLFFGYTQCPDVCPTSLSELAQAHQY